MVMAPESFTFLRVPVRSSARRLRGARARLRPSAAAKPRRAISDCISTELLDQAERRRLAAGRSARPHGRRLCNDGAGTGHEGPRAPAAKYGRAAAKLTSMPGNAFPAALIITSRTSSDQPLAPTASCTLLRRTHGVWRRDRQSRLTISPLPKRRRRPAGCRGAASARKAERTVGAAYFVTSLPV